MSPEKLASFVEGAQRRTEGLLFTATPSAELDAIGRWQQLSDQAFAGMCRAIVAAVSLGGCATYTEEFATINSRLDSLDAKVQSAAQSAESANQSAQQANQRLDQMEGRIQRLEAAPPRKPRG